MPYNATEGKARMAWGDKKNDKRANESPFNAGDPTTVSYTHLTLPTNREV